VGSITGCSVGVPETGVIAGMGITGVVAGTAGVGSDGISLPQPDNKAQASKPLRTSNGRLEIFIRLSTDLRDHG
jgi:hypothetical protein